MDSLVNSTKYLRINTNPHKPFQKIEEERLFPNSFYQNSENQNEDITKEENYKHYKRKVSISNIDTKILNKIQMNKLQQHLKKDVDNELVGFIPGTQG